MPGGKQRQYSKRRPQPASDPIDRRFILLGVLSLFSLGIYVILCGLSQSFAYGSDPQARPIRLVVGLFLVATIIYCVAAHLAAKVPDGRRLTLIIFLPAILFRGTMLFSEPIQEIDIYRYLWDGAVTRAGVNPFRYPPKVVLQQGNGRAIKDPEHREDLETLFRIRQQRPALETVLARIHYGNLPSVYPPVGQAVFAGVDAVTPDAASLKTRVNIMRVTLILIELATGGLVILLLSLAQKPHGLAVLFTWCPLLVKETANSGHLDAIAVFLTTLAVYFAARMLVRKRPDPQGKAEGRKAEGRKAEGKLAITEAPSDLSWMGVFWGSAAMLSLGLAVGAKLYPAILGFWFLFACVRKLGLKSLFPLFVFVAVTFAVLIPVLPTRVTGRPDPPEWLTQPSEGLETFLSRWEMNDFLFLIAIENIKNTEAMDSHNVAWFSIVPNGLRRNTTDWVSHQFGVRAETAPFHVARALTAVVFVTLAVAFAWRAVRSESLQTWLEMAFLTIAWFLLLCPTQNPWYWTWTLPLLAFARSRVWWLMSGVLFIYYLRFWFAYHYGNVVVGDSGYTGMAYFDLVVTWMEFAPWFLLLIVDGWRSSKKGLPTLR